MTTVVDQRVRLYQRLPLSDQDEWWIRRAAASPDERVLYLGCGTGRLATPMAAACDLLVGVDRDPAMLAAFDRRLDAESQRRVRLVEGDAADLRLGERFGAVVAPSNLLNGLPDAEARQAVVRTAAEHCLGVGTVVLQVLNPYWLATAGDGPAEGTIAARGGGDDVAVRVDQVEFEPWTQRLRARITYRFADGETLRDPVDAVALFPEELRRLTRDAGLVIVERRGAAPGTQPLGLAGGSWHLVCRPRR